MNLVLSVWDSSEIRLITFSFVSCYFLQINGILYRRILYGEKWERKCHKDEGWFWIIKVSTTLNKAMVKRINVIKSFSFISIYISSWQRRSWLYSMGQTVGCMRKITRQPTFRWQSSHLFQCTISFKLEEWYSIQKGANILLNFQNIILLNFQNNFVTFIFLFHKFYLKNNKYILLVFYLIIFSYFIFIKK